MRQRTTVSRRVVFIKSKGAPAMGGGQAQAGGRTSRSCRFSRMNPVSMEVVCSEKGNVPCRPEGCTIFKPR